MSDIEFVDAPPDHGGKYAEFFDALRARRGEWAIWPQKNPNSGTAGHIRKGEYGGCNAGEFEAAARTDENREVRIYVRYVGGGDGS